MAFFKQGKWALPTFVVALVLGVLISIQFQAQQRVAQANAVNMQKIAVSNKLLDAASQEKASLEQQQKELQQQIQDLSNQTGGISPSLQATITKMEIFTGETAVQGPGIHLEIDDRKVDDPFFVLPDIFIRIVNILKVAGAEAIEIDGQRIGPRTSIASSGTANILINGIPISRVNDTHWEIEAIGNQDTLYNFLQELEINSLITSFPDVKITLTKQNVTIPGLKTIDDFTVAKPIQ